MHIEGQLGYVQCNSELNDTLSSKWSIKDAGDGFVRIRSELNVLDYLHIENLQNQLQYGNIEDSWWSAMWILEPVIVTSIKSFSKADVLELYPNPSNGNFKLSLDSYTTDDPVSVSIFNIFGQLVFSNRYKLQNHKKQAIEIHTGDALPNGHYYVIASGKSGQAKAKLIIGR
jgi:hypothetical protein